MTDTETDFAHALVAPRATPRYPQRMRRFGRLIGTWAVSSRLLDESTGEWRESQLTWRFAFILDGRGVQDVITGPSAADPEVLEAKGTTIRVYDPSLGVWRVNWYGVAGGDYCTLVATGHSTGIRQDGTQTDGRPIRWNFSDITNDSFAWDGWVSNDEGGTWWLEQHMDATRVS